MGSSSPNRAEHKTYLSCHHLAIISRVKFMGEINPSERSLVLGPITR